MALSERAGDELAQIKGSVRHVHGLTTTGPLLKLMAGWVLRWLSAVRARLRQRLEPLLEFISLRHQLAVLQRTGTRRPCFRPSERLLWLFRSRWRANWQHSLIIVSPPPFCVGVIAAYRQSGHPAHVAAGAADAQGSIVRSAHL